MNNSKPRNRPVFWRNHDGVAAVEFALIFPVLLLIFVNVVALFDGLRASRLIARSAAVSVDLVTRFQGNDFTSDDFDEIIEVSKSIAGPYAENTNFTVVVTSIINVFDQDDDLTVAWSASDPVDNELADADLDEFDLPDLAQGDTLILVEVRANYTPILTSEIVVSFTLDDYQVRRPRFQTAIDAPD
ncbi:Flp pilus assembly protein TadG [Roseibium hamelinense]|uniref:Flp pilus assembly protein TadG n=1 Tax=Roseibium hamelinense TaxID=150831 RepID=A0A562SQ07_9HYPH|nr:TadE/TadG family type IV pilus assembly protein [Roseibium hamelinense]MTI43994.1 pilus assembly protein [Roseibium hamelinense]TWI82800.1 Flp pilus assembly protein TadG [Roseibium hamelinense]